MSMVSVVREKSARFFRSLVPDRGKAVIYGALHRMGGSSVYGFKRAAVLERAGRPRMAAEVYRKLLEANPEDQQTSFQAGRRLWRMGGRCVEDPLFACAVSDVRCGRGVPEFGCDFTYPGLWMHVRLEDVGGCRPDGVEIRLGGVLLRKHRIEWSEGRAAFQFIVKREVLSTFPRKAWLSVGIEGGRVEPDAALASALVEVPHGDGSLEEKILSRGLLEKKGGMRPSREEIHDRQGQYLAVYQRAARAFEELLGRKLFVLYGTLLGLQRSGDFIPGDDDFDVGYVSDASSPEEVKDEAAKCIRILVAQGFNVAVNRFGRPFRLAEPGAAEGIHLDVRPVWTRGDGHVWMHKNARLEMGLGEFRSVVPGLLRGAEVWAPAGAERFLRLYYGSSWRVPDPGFSNSGKAELEEVKSVLEDCCFDRDEQLRLCNEMGGVAGFSSSAARSGRFVATSLVPAYPLASAGGGFGGHRQ